MAAGLQYFGRSIHGTMDMNDDGLVDLAVGSLGAAVLLWFVYHPSKITAALNHLSANECHNIYFKDCSSTTEFEELLLIRETFA